MKTLKLNLLEKKEMNEVRGGKSDCNHGACPYNCDNKDYYTYIKRFKQSQAIYASLVAHVPVGPADR